MKQIPVASKALTIIFALVWMVGCASTDTSEADAAAAAAAEQAAAQAAAEQAEAEAANKARMMQQALEDAASAAGNVLYFEFDSATLRPAAQDILDAHIALAKTNGDSVRLEGHTDERGTREYNMALGERRAKAVANYMVASGVASYRIESVSYGEERPAASGSSEGSWSQNRRVEIK
jgi:peptidoglycan-associated lipoprotein